MLNITIIGSGSVAEGLARQISEAEGLDLMQVWARNPERGSWLASETGAQWSNIPAELAHADLYILAVSDGAVAGVSAEMPFPADAVVAHTAGCIAMGDMSPKITHRAVLYPLQSFTKGRRIADFRRTPFFIEGATPHALETVREAAEALSDNIIEMDSAHRAHIHLAGAFANNFSNAMFSVAEQIAADAGAPFDYIRPIIAETVAKAMEMPSPRLAQTGAAQRGDKTIQERHLAMLRAEHPEYVNLYEEISNTIWKISKKNSQG